MALFSAGDNNPIDIYPIKDPIDGSELYEISNQGSMKLYVAWKTFGSFIVSTINSATSALARRLYVVTGAAAPFTISLPLTQNVGDTVVVYNKDYTSSIVITVDAGVGGTIGDFGQTHRLGAQHAFYTYTCIASNTWIVSWEPSVKELRYRTSSPTISIIFGNSILYVDNASARTVTVPSDANDPLPIGFQMEVIRWGAGTLTMTPDVGVTINTNTSLALTSQFSRGIILKIAANLWTWNQF
jgi:hypothetical protein